MRHIAIVGMSFCGSTVLSHVLGALPGVANVGESHWIATRRGSGKPIGCNACGPNCEVLTQDFLASLADEPADWYQKLAERMGSQTIVSSDKNLNLLQRYDPSLDIDAVYCFRPPVQAYRSYLKSAKLPEGVEPLDFDRYLWHWIAFYGNANYGYTIKGRKFWVDFAEFAQNPDAELKRLCAKLELSYTPDAVEYWNVVQHGVGGNFNPYNALRQNKMDRLVIKPRVVPDYTEQERRGLENHPAAGMHDVMARWARQ